jgi:hypothetical protein
MQLAWAADAGASGLLASLGLAMIVIGVVWWDRLHDR